MSQKPRTPASKGSFRKLDGILLLDKPPGLSSNQALQRVRHLFRAEKAGHTGSLDPLATGLLPICFGEATKIAGGLLGARKAYDTVARLGIVTDTDDAEGQLLRERPVPPLTIDTIDAALRTLTGRIRQRPPIYSALKHGGEPLYAKARRGETVEVDEREVDVHAFELQSAADLLDTPVAPAAPRSCACTSNAARAPTSAAWCATWANCSAAAPTSPSCAGSGSIRSATRGCGPSRRCRRWPSAANAAWTPACCRSRPG